MAWHVAHSRWSVLGCFSQMQSWLASSCWMGNKLLTSHIQKKRDETLYLLARNKMFVRFRWQADWLLWFQESYSAWNVTRSSFWHLADFHSFPSISCGVTLHVISLWYSFHYGIKNDADALWILGFGAQIYNCFIQTVLSRWHCLFVLSSLWWIHEIPGRHFQPTTVFN